MAHFLLIYDRRAGELIRTEEFGAGADALRARFAAEEEFRGRNDVEIVALTAESEEELRRTHARYFLDLGQLVRRMG